MRIEKIKSIVNSVSDLVMKQCRIVLRRATAADEDRVFCNLLGRTLLKLSDNDDEGLLGYPAMVSRPLDFRSIDLRLAAGAYGGSHEAFFDDIQEVWHNIRTAYREQPDLIELAERLSQTFEELYNKEKSAEFANVNSSSSEVTVIKERDDLLAYASESLLPKAPWEEGICKVCGLDRDDDNVLLCDGCDSEYHTYCLSPPLVRIPEGNWYCPSCVDGQSRSRSETSGSQVVNQYKQKRRQREYTHKYMETLVQLANAMEIKEYWELTMDERIFLMKFFCDEALNSAIICDHIDQCAPMSTDLQQKHRSLTSEWKIQKFREEMLGSNSVKENSSNCENGESGADLLVTPFTSDNKAMGQLPDRSGRVNHISVRNIVPDYQLGGRGVSGQNKKPVSSQQQTKGQRDNDAQNPNDHPIDLMITSNLSSVVVNRMVEHETSMPEDSSDMLHSDKSSNQADAIPSKGLDVESGSHKNEISSLQDSIARVELELLKVSVRKEFLGRDCHGRLYWVFDRPGCRPGILVNSVISRDSSRRSTTYGAEKFSIPGEFSVQQWYSSQRSYGIPSSDFWMSFHSDSEIGELIEWLQDSDEREKELKESILQWRRNKVRIQNCHVNDLNKSEGISSLASIDGTESDTKFPVTKALTTLKKKFNSCLDTMPLHIQKYQALQAKDSTLYRCECLEPLWASRHHCPSCHQTFFTSDEQIQHKNQNCKPWTPPMSTQKTDCPISLEEIKAKMIIPSSLKDLMKTIGFLGTKMENGINPEINKSSTCMSNLKNKSSTISILRSAENKSHEGQSAERTKSDTEENEFFSANDKSMLNGVPESPIIHELSLRPLVGRVSEILCHLKINLLDMDAAVPEEALRISRSSPDRRRAWRAFTKSANTIYEMIQAIITLEDTIKSEYLKNDWWYWSSASAAAKTTTLSALALRMYALDSAILYDKSASSGDATEVVNPDCVLDQEAPQTSTVINTAKLGSPSVRAPDLDIPENTRPKTRLSKRRRE